MFFLEIWFSSQRSEVLPLVRSQGDSLTQLERREHSARFGTCEMKRSPKFNKLIAKQTHNLLRWHELIEVYFYCIMIAPTRKGTQIRIKASLNRSNIFWATETRGRVKFFLTEKEIYLLRTTRINDKINVTSYNFLDQNRKIPNHGYMQQNKGDSRLTVRRHGSGNVDMYYVFTRVNVNKTL